MGLIFESALKQLFVMFIFMAIGFVMRRGKLVGEDFGKGLSKIELYIFMPCLMINTFAQNCTLYVFREKSMWILVSTLILLLLCIPASRILARFIGKNQDEISTYQYSLCFPNTGYLGYPIISAVFGDQMLLNAMIFTIPFNIATYTYGMCILATEKEFSLKHIKNPVTFATLIGIILGLTGLKLPDVAYDVLEMGGDCMAPIAMLLTGHVLAGKPLKTQFTKVRVYVACAFRLIIIPIICAAALYLLNVRGDLFMISVTMLAMPMGLNSIVVPESYGRDAVCGSQSTFISNLMGIITIPIVISLASFFV